MDMEDGLPDDQAREPDYRIERIGLVTDKHVIFVVLEDGKPVYRCSSIYYARHFIEEAKSKYASTLPSPPEKSWHSWVISIVVFLFILSALSECHKETHECDLAWDKTGAYCQ
ncbi:hypothetical protein IGS68_19155 [Skermanella sp. TT6]|uniref:Uncharacterized protein n=1 Tax=Skermanella cutis TaxID=2775420 RepID=A0ABX7B1J7_9PROT|nr:hypothetical protein [Skermanella sp. TT6]QQP88163.1 hypothetical protein IGS68_19155 [Skermanella sp. TT6]